MPTSCPVWVTQATVSSVQNKKEKGVLYLLAARLKICSCLNFEEVGADIIRPRAIDNRPYKFYLSLQDPLCGFVGDLLKLVVCEL